MPKKTAKKPMMKEKEMMSGGKHMMPGMPKGKMMSDKEMYGMMNGKKKKKGKK